MRGWKTWGVGAVFTAVVFVCLGLSTAPANNFPPTPTQHFYGDADGDTLITTFDLGILVNYFNGQPYTFDTLQPQNPDQDWNTCDIDSDQHCTTFDLGYYTNYFNGQTLGIGDKPWVLQNMDLPLAGNSPFTWIPFTVNLYSTLSDLSHSGRPGVSVIAEIAPVGEGSTVTGRLSGRECEPVAGDRDQTVQDGAQCALSVTTTDWNVHPEQGLTESGTYGLQIWADGEGEIQINLRIEATELEVPAVATSILANFSDPGPTISIDCSNPGPNPVSELSPMQCTVITDGDVPIINTSSDTCGGSISGGGPWLYNFTPAETQGPGICIAGVRNGAAIDQQTISIYEVNLAPMWSLQPKDMVVGINANYNFSNGRALDYDLPNSSAGDPGHITCAKISQTCSFPITVSGVGSGNGVVECNLNFTTASSPEVCNVNIRVSDGLGSAITDNITIETARIWYVNDNASGNGSGTSWGNAFTTVQAALIASVAGDMVWVAEGVYISGNANPILNMKDEVKIYGGFTGNEAVLSQRADPSVHPSALDGLDISYNVVLGASNSLLDGFNIQNGYEAGILNNSVVNLSIKNCGIINNWRGIYNSNSSLTISKCRFNGNSTASNAGAIYNLFSSPYIINCVFLGNSANFGAGLYNNNSTPTITNCTFNGNTANYGGAIYNYNSSPIIKNSILWGDNAIGAGHELYNTGASYPTITYSDIMGGYSGTGNLNTDPLYEGYPDLHLKIGSPCLDRGIAEGAPNEDIESNSRPRGIGYDMGAYEGWWGPQCNDGIDNDGDALIDLLDPGCSDINDSSEWGTNACDDGFDNDGDTLRDFLQDPGCESLTDIDEHGPYQCDDGVDNDGDTLSDWPYDPSCSGPTYPNESRIWYVDSDATGPQNGTSWTTAFHDPQDAMNAAYSRDMIWVAQGDYRRYLEPVIIMKPEINVYGGFVGNETDLSQRTNPLSHPTYLGYWFNYHVVVAASNSRLDGFIVREADGRGEGEEQDRGGGMFINSAGGVVIANCIFQSNNTIYYGGGIYSNLLPSQTLTITNCTFSQNSISTESTMQQSGGGAVYLLGGTVTISNCAFHSNSAFGDGGAIYIRNTNPTITNSIFIGNNNAISFKSAGGYVTNCTFCGNSSGTWDGAVSVGGGSSATFNKCSFSGNSGDYDSIYVSGGANITDCIFVGNGVHYGGYGNGYSIKNCTFGRGALYDSHNSGNTYITNTILYDSYIEINLNNPIITYSDVPVGFPGTGNISSNPLFVGNPLYSGQWNMYSYNGSTNQSTYTCVKASWIPNALIGSYVFPNLNYPYRGFLVTANTATTVTFWTNTTDWAIIGQYFAIFDYHLSPGSPCINAGTSSGAPGDDLDGYLRPYPIGGSYDMGAYEWHP